MTTDKTPTAQVEASSRKRASNPNRGSKPGERRGGRQKGTPNKATIEFRETVQKLLDDNRDNVSKWLAQVALEDPDKALQRLSQLAEFAAPKLARTEHVGDGGGPVAIAAVEWHVVDPAQG